MEPNNPLYVLLLALIIRDFYVANGLREPEPTHEDLLKSLKAVNINVEEVNRLKTCVKIANFDVLGL